MNGTARSRLLPAESRAVCCRAQILRLGPSLARLSLAKHARHALWGSMPFSCRSSATDGRTSTAPRDTDERIATTLADLDALLGIESETPATENKVSLAYALGEVSGVQLQQCSIACLHG